MEIETPGLLRWAYRTARSDVRRYQAKDQPISKARLWHAVVPNLRRPIFVLGAPRSGTSFLGQCLGELAEVSYHHEPVATKAAARYVYEGTWAFARALRFYRRVYGWLMRIHLDGHLRFAEKTPRNCFIVPFLHRAFPDAQFVHIIRDGRDAALSYSQMSWLRAASAGSGQREPGGYLLGPYPRFWVERERRPEFETTSDLHRCIWAWRRHVESALAAAVHLPGTQYHEMRYEALVHHPDDEAERLLEFLQVANPDSRQGFLDAVSRVDTRSVGRWRDALTTAQLGEIEAEAGPLLERLGYTDRRQEPLDSTNDR